MDPVITSVVVFSFFPGEFNVFSAPVQRGVQPRELLPAEISH
jgi:hypothetical protein